MTAPPRIPIYNPTTGTLTLATPGDCEVCGFQGQALVVSVRAPVDEPGACPACTPFGARWMREEIAYRWRTSGGAA